MVGLAIITLISLHGTYRFAMGYSKRWEELTKHQLVFEIDLRHTSVTIENTLSGVRIFLSLRLRFENRDDHSRAMKRLNITLHRSAVRNVHPAAEVYTLFAILRISMNSIQIPTDQFEGMEIQSHRLTPFYDIEAMLAVQDDENIKNPEDLDAGDYLRIWMDGSDYQREFVADLHPHWEAAMNDKGTSILFVTGDAQSIRKDYRRLG